MKTIILITLLSILSISCSQKEKVEKTVFIKNQKASCQNYSDIVEGKIVSIHKNKISLKVDSSYRRSHRLRSVWVQVKKNAGRTIVFGQDLCQTKGDTTAKVIAKNPYY